MIAFLTFTFFICAFSARLGGLSKEHPPTPRVQELVDSLKPSIVAATSDPIQNLTVVSFKIQLVAGVNYFVKIQTSPEMFVHARIFQPLRGSDPAPKLVSVQEGHTRTSELSYF